MRRTLSLALIGLALGIALGLVVGWALWPVSYTNTAPSQLRQGERNDYVLMVAASYQAERNLDKARERLALLDSGNPAQPVVTLAEQLIASNGRPRDITMLVQLAVALESTTPAMAPYMEDVP